MTRSWTLKFRLIAGVLLVLVVVWAMMLVLNRQLVGGLNDRLVEAISQRALANARAAGSSLGFEIAAQEVGPAKEKLDAFAAEHKELYAAVVLTADKKEFSRTGTDLDVVALLAALGNTDTEKVDEQGELVIAFSPIAEDEGKVLGYIIYAESLAEQQRYQRTLMYMMLGAMITGALIIILAVYFIGARTARPINQLVEAAERIADGDLRQVEVEVGGSLETTRLATSVRQMGEALQRQVRALKTLTVDVANVSREAAEAMAHLASSASEQAAAVAETAATVEEMEQAAKSAAKSADQIVHSAGKTTEVSIRGRQAVETTSEIILQIKDDSQEISEKSKALLSNVEEVGNVIGSVNAIAEQSKILAVNASIEAAKAGEYGAGFAVVAQEVKDLAQQSKEATLQITNTLTAIRQAIEVMVTTSESGARRTEDGVNTVGNAGAIVNDLSEAIRENSEFANIIATNNTQQTLGLTQIATAIEQINATALENQEISKKIETSTKQVTASMDKLTDLIGTWKTPDSPE